MESSNFIRICDARTKINQINKSCGGIDKTTKKKHKVNFFAVHFDFAVPKGLCDMLQRKAEKND